jgi:hypothetical protein
MLLHIGDGVLLSIQCNNLSFFELVIRWIELIKQKKGSPAGQSYL